MTDIAISGTIVETGAEAPLFTRRMRALFQLVRLGRRREDLASRLDFADDHVAADVGVRRDRHRDDWLNAFLAR
jgi:hypothetical protein